MDMELSKLDRANDGEIRQFVDENSFPECPDTKIDDLKVEMNAFNNGPKVLPFEFRALEACLEAACSSLESEVRDELEHLLDDDGDMAEMYLTAKLMQKLDGVCSPTSFPGARGREEHELAHSDAEDESGVEVLNGTFNSLGGDKESSTSSRVHSGTKGLDVEELEMLLEAYFVQIDGTLNKLSVLRGYVDDTEDYINIMLDGKQNHLLQMGVVLTTTTLIISLFVVVAGVMGMNVRISLFNTGFPQWLQIVIGSTISCIFLDIVAIAWFKHKRLV
ncbi:magnesium transporter MRS2-3 isoform X2 [Cryptomeria japonica]|uniref:magnesium transporter MRS2-3 isoform X2 n=1 Tax=Cryptomeria japonica TaxID=3369 RepID=UPI0027DA3FB1|nr:magnesium transporter MRS2-3 isoform X2 [Cryptomeria japonica]